MHPFKVIARFVLLEALRSGLPWLALACIAAGFGVAVFLAQVTLTETREFQAAATAAVLRACAVFLIAAHVVASMAREANDRGLELALTLPISRPAYYAGKLAGFACCGALLAAAFAIPLLLWSTPAAVVMWCVSLGIETALVAAMALFFSMALTVVPAIAATAGLYLLGRSISALQSIAAGPLAEKSESSLRGVIDLFAVLLPRLDSATRTEWLVYGPASPSDFLAALTGLTVYSAVVVSAGLFDFSRRNL